jgi:hypothetical protein
MEIILFISYIISYTSKAYSCDVTIEFTPTPSRFVYNVFNAQPSLLTLPLYLFRAPLCKLIFEQHEDVLSQCSKGPSEQTIFNHETSPVKYFNVGAKLRYIYTMVKFAIN